MNHKNEGNHIADSDEFLCPSQTPAVVEAVTTTSERFETAGSTCPEMKRSAVKELIERYFYQLQRGCGDPTCLNSNCASSGRVPPMTANEIAARAIQLFSQDAQLCGTHSSSPDQRQSKMPCSNNDSATSSQTAVNSELLSPGHENSTSSSSSGNSTITSGSSEGSKSSSASSSTSNTTTTTNTDEAVAASGILPAYSSTEICHNGNKLEDIIVPESPLPVITPSIFAAAMPPTRFTYLDEEIIDSLLDECLVDNKYERLVHAINEVYSNVCRLGQSYLRRRRRSHERGSSGPKQQQCNTKVQEILRKSPSEFKKEDLRTLQGENDKDEDSTTRAVDEEENGAAIRMEHDDDHDVDHDNDGDEPMDEDDPYWKGPAVAELNSNSNEIWVDLKSLRRVKKKLFQLNNKAIGDALNSNIMLLAESISYSIPNNWEQVLHCLVICFDMATNTSNQFADLEYLERSLPKLCHTIRTLPIAAQVRLSRIWATHCKDQLHSLVQCFQQLISLHVMLDEDSVQENVDVIAVTKAMKIAYFANLLAGHVEKPLLILESTTETTSASATTPGSSSTTDRAASVANDDDDLFFFTQVPKSHISKFAEDRLEKELNVSCMNCRQPLVPYEEFYNEPLSDAIQMDRDYLAYRNMSLDSTHEDAHFSFMLYSFILTPATKVIALYYDSRIRMYSERNSSLYSLLNTFAEQDSIARPDLKLKVRREKIIDDALIGLEMVAMNNPKDLKKQLVVEFVGEEGIDEGGVSKEFFQLIVDEIFNPAYGMFTQQEDTNTVWFNSAPFENDAQFTLVGIILGLAIYNNIILAVNFPMVVYRKLMGGQGTFFDLADWHPTLYRSLKSMLDYEESDMEEVFMQNFKINYMSVFDEMLDHELKPGGSEILVGQHNKQEFVDLYSDFLLNRNVERQFKAFKKGFDMVTDESPLKLLFRPEEVELLVCGSRNYDFHELERSTEYDGGYTKETQIIKDFWIIMHALPEESKRKLIQFTTGSDRVPVGGLSRLKLLITRHGPDSDRLPTSHTCFNVLLLPEYNSKEKLEERLLKAINYSKGFGML